MESTVNENNVKKILIVFIAILILLLAGVIWYAYDKDVDAKVIENTLTNEKNDLIKRLTITKDSLDASVNDKTALSEELIAKSNEIQNLIEQIEKGELDKASLMQYKNEALKLRTKVSYLIKEVDKLKNDNSKLITERDSTNVALNNVRKMKDTLLNRNSKLAETVLKGTKLSVLNLEVASFKQKGSGKQIPTDKANKVDALKISFMVAENKIAPAMLKIYNVQVIDSKGNVIAGKKTESFGDKSLTYSFSCEVNYEQKTLKVERSLAVNDLEPGTFFINVYDKDELVTNSSFTLK